MLSLNGLAPNISNTKLDLVSMMLTLILLNRL